MVRKSNNEPNYINVKLTLCKLLSHYVDEETLARQFYDAQIRNLAVDVLPVVHIRVSPPSGQVVREDTHHG